MNLFPKIRKAFSEEKNRYTEWVQVAHNIPGFLKTEDGKEKIRMVDIYERYDKVKQEYEIKHIYRLPARFTFL